MFKLCEKNSCNVPNFQHFDRTSNNFKCQKKMFELYKKFLSSASNFQFIGAFNNLEDSKKCSNNCASNFQTVHKIFDFLMPLYILKDEKNECHVSQGDEPWCIQLPEELKIFYTYCMKTDWNI